MKKTLLLLAVAAMTMGAFAQRTWIVGNDATNFPVYAGIGAGPNVSVFKVDLGIHTGTVTNVNMGQVEAAEKTFNGVTYPNRFKFNGGGYPAAAATDLAPTVMMPTQRFLTMKVTGPGSIKIQGVTGSSASERRLFITDGVNLIGTMIYPAGSAISESTVEYTGGEAILYLFCNSAINIYRIEATSATTHASLPASGINDVFAEKGIYFNGNEIVNNKKLSMEVFDVLGKKIGNTEKNFNMGSLSDGIYMVRAEGIFGTMKFTK